MELNQRAVEFIGKVIGVKFFDLAKLDEVLKVQKKEHEFREVADFMFITEQPHLGPFLFRAQALIEAHVEQFVG